MSKSIVLVSLYFCIFSIIGFCQTYSDSLTAQSDVKYNELKHLTNQEDPSLCNELLHKLKTNNLFRLAKTATSKSDSVFLYRYIAQELANRVKRGDGHNNLYNELNNIDKENDGYKYFILWTVYNIKENFNPILVKDIFKSISPTISNFHSSSPQVKLLSIVTSTDLIQKLNESEEIQEDDISEYCEYLTTVALDNNEDPQVRRAAIKGIAELKYYQGSKTLLDILHNKENASIVPVIRSACIALADLGYQDAVAPISNILSSTDNEYVYASAAVALSNLGGEKSLVALLDNVGRIDGGYCDCAIGEMDKYIIDELNSSLPEMLPYVIEATKYLYKEEQIIVYKPLLINILYKIEDQNIRKLILERLVQLVTKEEASEIIKIIPQQKYYSDEWNLLRTISQPKRKSPVKIEPKKTPDNKFGELDYGNFESQEFGDPGYRENDFWWAGLDYLGHTGLMSGIDNDHIRRILEVGGTERVVRNNEWAAMQGHNFYWGAYTINRENGRYMTFARRRAVINTANLLVGRDIGYPVFPTSDALRHVYNPGPTVTYTEITDLRCDGLIEYCYEFNSVNVWGNNGANYNISITANVDDHNDFYDWPYDPNTELAPIVQCGEDSSGGNSSYMTRDARIDVPTYDFRYEVNAETINIAIRATDRSGIHFIAYLEDGEDDWLYSPTQSQFPSGSSYTFSFELEMEESNWIHYWAVDGASNYPEYAEHHWVDITNSVDNQPLVVIPSDFSIKSIYPNPFNYMINAVIEIPQTAIINVELLNLLGKKVAVLAGGKYSPGSHQLSYNADYLPSGNYFIRFSVPGRHDELEKIVLLK
ncbi:MAG: T9SS type A sorting domain-containing protein [Candidatus Electryonea clarkiae]|nr:T9SS type A sorting domain-containing protein [Candidatus Electryonea clarkiae]MDP8287188.1 T9SS type A sorting domain-containing protein [Candidatus Electryonea clarkiae]